MRMCYWILRDLKNGVFGHKNYELHSTLRSPALTNPVEFTFRKIYIQFALKTYYF